MDSVSLLRKIIEFVQCELGRGASDFEKAVGLIFADHRVMGAWKVKSDVPLRVRKGVELVFIPSGREYTVTAVYVYGLSIAFQGDKDCHSISWNTLVKDYEIVNECRDEVL